MREAERGMTPRKQRRLLRRAEQARRAADRIKTNERVRAYKKAARQRAKTPEGQALARFKAVYETNDWRPAPSTLVPPYANHPEWPFRWKPKAWLERRGYERLLPEPWP